MFYQKTAVSKNLILFVGLPIVLELLFLQRVISVTEDPTVCEQFERWPKNGVLVKVHKNFNCSYISSRYVSYIETYRVRKWFSRRIATRINYRWEPYVDLRVIHKCCDGYRSGESITGCVPVCPSGCNNGECYKPNVCKCFSGFVHSLDTHNGYIECVPYCSSGCKGGACTAPEVCTCEPGYQLAKDRKSCVPLCFMSGTRTGIHSCGNHASCVAPNVCECDYGYEKNSKSTQPLCLPTCDPPCSSNAFCDSPNKCLCNTGYINANNEYDTVRIQNKQFYSNSFSMVNSTSMSHDDDTTTELPFSSTKTSSSMLCVPTCVPECGEGSSCIAPNICQCNQGYRSESLLNGPDHQLQCAPVCYPPCLNAQCVYPNECICNSGYKLQPAVEDRICVPICQDECDSHESCTLPDHCECDDGYAKNVTSGAENYENVSTSICIPICPDGCPINGKCIAPGQCDCDAGYVLVGGETIVSTITDVSITSDLTTEYYSTNSTSYSSNADTTYNSGDDASYSSSDSTTYSRSDGISYSSSSSDSTTYSSSDGISYSSSSSDITADSSTISPIFPQFCQPICEPTCPRGFTCIAPPDQCQLEISGDRESNGTSNGNGTSYRDGNGTKNGIKYNTTESAVFSYATVGTIGTIAVLGIGLVIYLTRRKRRKAATCGLDKSMVAIMDHSEASEPLFTNDQSSYL